MAADVYLNVQGDEPLTRPEQIASLLEVMKDSTVQVGTLMTPAAAVDINSPSAVKVVTDAMARRSIFQERLFPLIATVPARVTLSIWVSMRIARRRLTALSDGRNRLWSARNGWNSCASGDGISIYVGETPHDSIGVDTEEDVRRVEEILRGR